MRKSMLILMLGAVAAGCVSFKPVWYVAPQEFISQHEPGEVLMKTYDGDKRVMRNPTVLNGVVYGHQVLPGRLGRGDPFEVPVDSIAGPGTLLRNKDRFPRWCKAGNAWMCTI